MKKSLFLLMITGMILAFSHSIALDQENDQLESYLYSSLGRPAFLKLYVPKLGRKNNHPSHHNFQPIRNMIPIGQQIYSDEKGEFMIIMIKEGYWTCPACGTKNPDYNEYCSNSNCPLSW